MPDFSNPELEQCADCGHHFQISPRGEVQGGACPDCGGKRLFRMQPNPVQSEGTLRNMVDMETGKDAGGNPDGEGILAPPSGRAILAEFMNAPIDMMQGQCRHCGGDVLEFPDGRRTCDHCGLPFEPEQEASGIPDELRGQIAGAPLTEGTIMQTDHTDPYDTGAHGRDEYTHGHVIAAVVESGQWEDQPGGEQQYRKTSPSDNLRCPHCHEQVTGDKGAEAVFCPNCAHEWPIYRDEPHTPQYIMPGQGKNPGPDSWSRFPIPMIEPEMEHLDLGPIHQGRVASAPCPECGKSTTTYPNGTTVCNGHTCKKAWDAAGKEIGITPPATEAPGPVKAFTPYMANEAEGVVFGETPAMKNDFMKW